MFDTPPVVDGGLFVKGSAERLTSTHLGPRREERWNRCSRVGADFAPTWILDPHPPRLLGGGRESLQAGPSTASPYIEVQPGDLPLILSAGHGGSERPAEVSGRGQALVVNDWGSQALARDLADELEDRTGRRPHLVINHLHRSKLDPNRSLDHAAQGDPIAEQAWRDYHGAIDEWADLTAAGCGWGLYVDVHSYGEREGVQFGYGLSPDWLEESDEDLSKRSAIYASNVRNLALSSPLPLAEVVRGPESLGGRLEARGYWAVPAPRHPLPEVGYFDGGYSVYRHGSRNGGALDAIQVEVPYDLLRGAFRARFVPAFAESLSGFLAAHYRLRFEGERLCSGYVDVAWGHWALKAIRALREAGRDAPCRSQPAHFCPDSTLDRSQAAQMIWAALAEAGSEPGDLDSPFIDLKGSPAARAVAALWSRGYLDGCSLSEPPYCPEAPMTRAAMAAVVARISAGPGVIPSPPGGQYLDASRGHWGSWWLETAARRGVLPPCAEGPNYVCPDQLVTRAEAAWMLAQAIGLTP